jgi:hypothetical protein
MTPLATNLLGFRMMANMKPRLHIRYQFRFPTMVQEVETQPALGLLRLRGNDTASTYIQN